MDIDRNPRGTNSLRKPKPFSRSRKTMDGEEKHQQSPSAAVTMMWLSTPEREGDQPDHVETR